jgi:hypothetical protein
VSIAISDDFLNYLKPFAVIWILESLLLIECLLWLTPLTGIGVNGYVFFAVFAATSIITRLMLPHDKIIKIESKEFNHYSKSKKMLWDLLSILVILGVLTFTVFSFSEFGKIYHR